MLEPEQVEILEELAHETRKSKSNIVREAIDRLWIERQGRKKSNTDDPLDLLVLIRCTASLVETLLNQNESRESSGTRIPGAAGEHPG